MSVDPKLVYPCADVQSLAAVLRELCGDRERLRRLGSAARERMANWSQQDTVNASVEAVANAIRRRHR